MTDRRRPFEHMGTALRVLRTRAELTQTGLADRAQLTKAQISTYETGRQTPTIGNLEKILVALGIDLFELGSVMDEIARSTEALGRRGGGEEGRADGAALQPDREEQALRALRRGFEEYLQVVREVARRGGSADPE